jgi:hypothetical protein
MLAKSNKPVFEKLGFKKEYKAAVINAPTGFKTPVKIVENPRLSGEFDLILFFAFSSSDLHKKLPTLKRVIKNNGKVWVAWQKGRVTDLDRDNICKIGEGVGLDSVSSCSIDERWSALKLMYPKSQRA